MNVPSLVNNISQVEIIAVAEWPEFLVQSETHVTEDVSEGEMELEKYDQMSSLFNSTKTESVVIYYRKCWTVEMEFERKEEYKYWILACSAVSRTVIITNVAIYRSPRGSEAEFCAFFQEMLENICEDGNGCTIIRNFNI